MKAQPHAANQVQQADVVSLGDLLDYKFGHIIDWLVENGNGAGESATQVEAEGFQQAWHYGYAAALRDIRDCLVSAGDPIN